MDIRRLEVFCKVVDLGSFTRAAEAALLSQPSVSEHIRTLEEHYNEKLIDRLGRRAQPTHAGKILYQYARRIIQLKDEADQAIKQFQGNLSGKLAVGASTIPGAYLLPTMIDSFKSSYSSIELMLKISGTTAVVEDILKGTLELGLIGTLWKDQRVECEEMFSDELVLTVYPDHPWAKKSSVYPGELLEMPFILREPGSGTRIEMTQGLKKAGVEVPHFQVVAEVGSNEAVRQGVRSRIGVAILSSLSVAEDVERGSLVTVPIEGVSMPRSFYLVQRRNRQLSPLATAFYNHLKEHC
ncbi:selenium metabolism-associated LysR family transcriptional regulator [Desulfuromonas acetoxidans]|uniref:Transcriptional regulator, LysR family n=1 Tax=Desulfuromonas acetoxidans (strain DSM 684 / 11070) TaxID=281689 RepID=Q1K103_DESA6|nr:selenium metabolism-associated LysR family transcriptional regulator [Desulfuromonas acetoxidans]EAT16205.1 transcriptional regulator, LysR family [Desulfuromonas acetoxidans DSM 684]MBF0645221.1 LysR family transcriptional regulator [Desulfuromonas acetoxidans]NVD23035.1 LysR family transcriptional regulator [Desulfuromonas acetoxidans]NVE15724.1 LysR family transcriptional regulator [Desulfuromonas acetoxidans]